MESAEAVVYETVEKSLQRTTVMVKTRSSELLVDGKSQRNAEPSILTSEQTSGYPPTLDEHRALLPDSIGSNNKPGGSLWNALKNSFGKELSRISLPVHYNEPLSMLQRMLEDMEYWPLLQKAAKAPCPVTRAALITAFAFSNYSTTVNRANKPFNPMLGETCEYICREGGWRYFSEQVSHHPAVSACWAEHNDWSFRAEVNAKSRISSKGLEIVPLGTTFLHLRKLDETYTYQKVTSSVGGFLTGGIYLDHHGDMVIRCQKTGVTATLTFHPRGWSSKSAGRVSGEVVDKDGKVCWKLDGNWQEWLALTPVNVDPAVFEQVRVVFESVARPPATTLSTIQNIAPTPPGSVIVWRRQPPKPEARWNMSNFAISMNETNPDLERNLCPTDSRFRPDQRAMEILDYDGAEKHKLRLEESQRARRRVRESEQAVWKPRWFAASEISGGGWIPFGAADGGQEAEYWVHRQMESDNAKRWSGCETRLWD